MFKPKKLLLISGLFLLLILIRMYEEVLFYDPLLSFFKSEYATRALPEFNMLKLLVHTTVRYFLNTCVSLGVIWVLFKKQEIVKLSAVLYLALYIVLLLVFYISLQSTEAGEHMLLFYIRRFLIQPLLLLILVPAFYFHLKR